MNERTESSSSADATAMNGHFQYVATQYTKREFHTHLHAHCTCLCHTICVFSVYIALYTPEDGHDEDVFIVRNVIALSI